MLLRRRWVLTIAAAIASQPGNAQAGGFRSSDVGSAANPSVQAVAHMSELMRQRSGGRLLIADLGVSDPDSERFTVAQVRTGMLDMARVSVSALHGTVPATVIPTLPFLFASTEQRRRSLEGPVGEELLASLAAVDLVGLCFYDAGPRSIYTPGKPVRTPADMKGLKIRVQTSSTMAEVMHALGAHPVQTPYAHVRTQLAAGTIGAAENNLVSYLASRHHEVAGVYSLTEHVAPPAVVIFSSQVWNRLPKEDQGIIRERFGGLSLQGLRRAGGRRAGNPRQRRHPVRLRCRQAGLRQDPRLALPQAGRRPSPSHPGRADSGRRVTRQRGHFNPSSPNRLITLKVSRETSLSYLLCGSDPQ